MSFPFTLSMRIGKVVSYCEYDALEHMKKTPNSKTSLVIYRKVLIHEGLWCLRSLPEKHR